jgi:hypothetical protein
MQNGIYFVEVLISSGLICISSIQCTASAGSLLRIKFCLEIMLIRPIRSQEHHRHFFQGYSAIAGLKRIVDC